MLVPLLNLSNIFGSLAITTKKQQVRVPEWETGDKNEGQNGEFCFVCCFAVFALRYSKLNLTLVALRSLADRGLEGKGKRLGEFEF